VRLGGGRTKQLCRVLHKSLVGLGRGRGRGIMGAMAMVMGRSAMWSHLHRRVIGEPVVVGAAGHPEPARRHRDDVPGVGGQAAAGRGSGGCRDRRGPAGDPRVRHHGHGEECRHRVL
jgi:hypothetical protein